MKNTSLRSRPSLHRGMSLIEILVGLVIALIGMLIMFQVFTTSGERSRTTTSGSDAQIAGTLALFQLERDIKQAGLGFGRIPVAGTAGGVAGCTVAAYNSTLTTPTITGVKLAPVQIIQGASGAPDQIVVMYGNSSYFVTSRQFNSTTATSKSLVRRDAFNNGDVVLMTDEGVDATGNCALVEITGRPSPDDGVTVNHVQGATYASFPSGTNVVATMNAATAVVATGTGRGFAYNLGPTPSRNLWQVTPAGAANPNMLVWRNTLRSDTSQPVTEGIVNLQAEYGVDDGAGGTATANDAIISPSEWSAAAPADWSRVLAIRFAVLARSQQYEKAAVTTAAPTWANGANTFTMFDVDGGADSNPNNTNDWRHYRYRVYEAVVPLRNMIWGSTS